MEKVQHNEVDVDSDATTVESQAMPHHSMVTVRLSEPPNLTVNTSILNRPIEVLREEQLTVGTQEDEDDSQEQEEESPRITMMDPNGEVMSPTGSESAASEIGESRRGSESSEASEGGVNWEELEKTEEQEPRNEGSDDVSCVGSGIQYEDANDVVYGSTSSPTRTGK